MSYYGAKISNKYTIHKRRLQANGEFRFGGANIVLAYRVPEAPEGTAEVPVILSDSDTTVFVLNTGSSDCVSVAIKQNDVDTTINAAQLVDLSGELKLQQGVHAALLEGTLTLANNEVHTSESDMAVIVVEEPEIVLTGTGKLLTFTL